MRVRTISPAALIWKWLPLLSTCRNTSNEISQPSDSFIALLAWTAPDFLSKVVIWSSNRSSILPVYKRTSIPVLSRLLQLADHSLVAHSSTCGCSHSADRIRLSAAASLFLLAYTLPEPAVLLSPIDHLQYCTVLSSFTTVAYETVSGRFFLRSNNIFFR